MSRSMKDRLVSLEMNVADHEQQIGMLRFPQQPTVAQPHPCRERMKPDPLDQWAAILRLLDDLADAIVAAQSPDPSWTEDAEGYVVAPLDWKGAK